jgi:hypothetical protein
MARLFKQVPLQFIYVFSSILAKPYFQVANLARGSLSTFRFANEVEPGDTAKPRIAYFAMQSLASRLRHAKHVGFASFAEHGIAEVAEVAIDPAKHGKADVARPDYKQRINYILWLHNSLNLVSHSLKIRLLVVFGLVSLQLMTLKVMTE